MSDLKNLPGITSQEQSKKLRAYFNPLLIFQGNNKACIQKSHGELILKSEWKIIKHQVASWYKKNKLTDKRVKEINEQMEEERKEETDRFHASKYKKPKRKGFIYILKLKNRPIYKIGISSNPTERAKSFPIERTLLHTILSSDMRSDEQKLHDLFKNERITIPDFKGQEWFKLTKKDVQYLMNLNIAT